jgi:hypothetical protein
MNKQEIAVLIAIGNKVVKLQHEVSGLADISVLMKLANDIDAIIQYAKED